MAAVVVAAALLVPSLISRPTCPIPHVPPPCPILDPQHATPHHHPPTSRRRRRQAATQPCTTCCRYIDNAAMQLIRNPKFFDVVVTGECSAKTVLLSVVAVPH